MDKIENGQIHLTDGSHVPARAPAFLATATPSRPTPPKAKRWTTFFWSPPPSRFAAVNREQFYVSISRGREHRHVFTDDKELLQRRVGDSRSRAAALDLVKLREALGRKGFTPRARPDAGATSPLLI